MKQKEKLNIVYILLDQVKKSMLSTYGHNIVKTPNIDRLSKEGVTFDNAFTPASVCGPARTSLFTGLLPTQHGIVKNGEKGGVGEIPTTQSNIMNGLTDYNTYVVGKWHVGTKSIPKEYNIKGHNFDGYGYPGSKVYKNLVFDQAPTYENRYEEWLIEKGYEIPEVKEAYFGENKNLRIQELSGLLTGSKEQTIPYFIIDEAKKFIKESKKEGKPFFTWINFWGPHTPCVVPEPYYSMYNKEDVKLDESFFKPLENKPNHFKMISKMWGMWQASEDSWKNIITKFWGYITLIDDAIGELFKYLEENDLYDKTYIVITADHGDAMGHHKMIEKGEFMFDSTYNIPMIVKDPYSNRKNERDQNFVYLHDLTSTAYDVADKKIPDKFHGKSIQNIIRNKESNDRKGLLCQLAGHFIYFEQRMWRRKDYKLVFNASDVCELYDIKNDELELNNLFYNPKYNDIKKEMLKELYTEMKKVNDPLLTWLHRIIEEV